MSELDVRIVKLEPMRVASLWGYGPEPETIAWEKLRAWADPKGLLDDFDKRAYLRTIESRVLYLDWLRLGWFITELRSWLSHRERISFVRFQVESKYFFGIDKLNCFVCWNETGFCEPDDSIKFLVLDLLFLFSVQDTQ